HVCVTQTHIHHTRSLGTYPPLRVGVRPKRVQRPTDMSSELSTVTTAAKARPHLDLTMSILPVGQRGHIKAAPPQPLVCPAFMCPDNQGKSSWFNQKKGTVMDTSQSRALGTFFGNSNPGRVFP
uniref:Uncharacterized protein n=1 Tax=Sciurus vulgaris TaxID=55149 RepID=A0A8D2DJJ9_SCIVU